MFLPTDLFVHEGMGEHGLVHFIVAKPPVTHLQHTHTKTDGILQSDRRKRFYLFSPATDQVDDHVLVEGASPLSGDLTHIHHRLGVICVHVEDGGIDDPCYISGVRRRARHTRVRGEADLTYKYIKIFRNPGKRMSP